MLAARMRMSAVTPLFLEKRDSAISSSATITWPAGVEAGDLAVIWDLADTNFGSPSAVLPSGFTRIGSHLTDADVSTGIYYKICTGGESGSITCMDGGTQDDKILVVFSGGVTSVNVQDVTHSVNTTTRTASASTNNGEVPLIVFGMIYSENSSVTWSSVTAEDEAIDNANVSLSYKIYNIGDTPVDISYLGNSGSGDQGGASFYIECS